MQSHDLDELKSLVAELRAEHVAQKEKEKRESWTKYVSLTMVVIAVLAALASLRGGGFSSRTLTELNQATFNQAQASDQWAFYQSKSIKQNLYEIELDHLNAAAMRDTAAVAKITAKIKQYETDKTNITTKATAFEQKRNEANDIANSAAEHSKQMGLSITLFQVAIALGAMCLIVKKKPLWLAAMMLGALAAGKMVYVLYLLPL